MHREARDYINSQHTFFSPVARKNSLTQCLNPLGHDQLIDYAGSHFTLFSLRWTAKSQFQQYFFLPIEKIKDIFLLCL